MVTTTRLREKLAQQAAGVPLPREGGGGDDGPPSDHPSEDDMGTDEDHGPDGEGTTGPQQPSAAPQGYDARTVEQAFDMACKSELFRSLPRHPGDGKRDAHALVAELFNKVDELRCIYPAVPMDRLYRCYATSYLEGDTSSWWFSVKNSLPSWESFFKAFLKKYGDPNFKYKRAKALIRTLQTATMSVDDYNKMFRENVDGAELAGIAITQDMKDYQYFNGLQEHWQFRLNLIRECGALANKPNWPDGADALARSALFEGKDAGGSVAARGATHPQPTPAPQRQQQYPPSYNNNNNRKYSSTSNNNNNHNNKFKPKQKWSSSNVSGNASSPAPLVAGAAGSSSAAAGMSQGRDYSHIKCYNCNQFGHYQNRCPNPKQKRD